MFRFLKWQFFLFGLVLLVINGVWRREEKPSTVIAFLSNRDGSANVYRMFEDGSGQRPLTRTQDLTQGYCWLDWALHGGWLYTRYGTSNLQGGFECYPGERRYARLDMRGQLYPQAYASTLRSPDERWLLRTELSPFTGYPERMYRMRPDGSRKELLVLLDEEQPTTIRWSPDNEWIVYADFHEMHRMRPDSSQPRSFVFERWCYFLTVSPEWVYFISGSRCTRLYRTSLDAEPFGAQIELMAALARPVYDEALLSPDGQWLASWDVVDDKLYIFSTRTGDYTEIDDFALFPFIDYARGTWSPDSQWLVYSSQDSRHHLQLYRVHPDGSARQRLTYGVFDHISPRYSPPFAPPTWNRNRVIGVGVVSVIIGLLPQSSKKRRLTVPAVRR